MTFSTFWTRRKIRKSWDCDARELRLVLRLPKGYRFSGMQVGCARVVVEYFCLEEPDLALSDSFDLQVPVRGDEACHVLREDQGEEVLNVWVPRHLASSPGYDPSVPRGTLSGRPDRKLAQVAS
jgi:hypothetical protein